MPDQQQQKFDVSLGDVLRDALSDPLANPPSAAPSSAHAQTSGNASDADADTPLGTGLAESRSLGDRFVLKSGDTFLVNDVFGDIRGDQDGLYVNDTRVLSRLELTLGGRVPSLLSGNVDTDNTVFTAHLTNLPLPELGQDGLGEGVVHVRRTRVVTRNGVDEAIGLTHYGQAPTKVPLVIVFAADFKDMFEVRGSPRKHHGETFAPVVDGDAVSMRYQGLDRVERRVEVRFCPSPLKLAAGRAEYLVELQPGRSSTIYLKTSLSTAAMASNTSALPSKGLPDVAPHVAPYASRDVQTAVSDDGVMQRAGQADAGVSENVSDTEEDRRQTLHDGRSLGRIRFREALVSAHRQMRLRNRESAAVRTGNTLFNAWLGRSKADLNLLTTDLPTGPYPYAGIPWFSTAFGRDGIITAMQMLWLQPSLAQGVLRFHAAHQARDTSAFRDAAPGKIMHETRKSEMAATGEVPFAMYYGGVDTTPLFVMLAGEYHTRTGDMALINELWSSLQLATQWISNVCDQSPLGLLAYQRGAASGLANQGWKDSQDSVFHADGRFPEGPIALIEVQAYACEAFSTMARLAGLRGEHADAVQYDSRAAALKERIETHFWMEDQQFYGIAVGGDNALCRVRASNVGHLLSVGLPSQARAEAVIAHLRSSEFDNGWGIRTLASGQARFNPMSYHNGSVWPHDTALCAKGIARYGDKRTAIKLLKTLHEAAVGFDMRLPELFCGFTRTRGEPPTAYPVACLPQAWATGAPFMLLEACLGIHIDALRKEILIERPALPEGVDHLEIQGLQVAGSTVSLSFSRVNGRVVPSSTSSELKVVAVL